MRILDLCCGEGGASMGLSQAFPDAEIVGVDIRPMPRYPFELVQGDAINFCARFGQEFDFVWASPPCQAFTPLKAASGKTYENLIPLMRRTLMLNGVQLWVMENVPQAPLRRDLMLCGAMFDLRVYRHRIFECSWGELDAPAHPKHVIRATGSQRQRKLHYENGGFITITGDVGTYCGPAMGIDWMSGNGLSQAIPPAYSRYLAQFIPLDVERAA